jgi:hypothetical protein
MWMTSTSGLFGLRLVLVGAEPPIWNNNAPAYVTEALDRVTAALGPIS